MLKTFFNNPHVSVYHGTSEILVQGWFYYNGHFYKEKAAEIFKDVNTEDEFLRIIIRLNGNFSITCMTAEYTFIAVDRIMSFPIVYSTICNEIIVSDSVDSIKKHLRINDVNKDRLVEFVASSFIAGNNTLFENIKLLQAGKYAKINNYNNKIELKEYFNHTHKDYYSFDKNELCKIHNEIIDNVFQRMIESINNKQILLFLSGGYDSRLVAVTLKKLNYNNVVCVSFGKSSNKDVIVASEVAKKLGFDWILIENPKKYIKSVMHTKRFENYILNTAYGYSIPYIQGIICELLIKEEKVNRDCVIISGNSGDVIEGDQFSPHFTRGNTYSIDSIIDSIIDKHYKVFGEDYSKDSLLREVVKENIEQKSVYTYEEAQDIYENFNWRERQSKYVVNDVRSYDCYLNNEWRLPLWDNELVDFWLKVPIEYRANRKLYYYCIKEEKLPTANNKSTYDKINSFLKRKSSGLVKALYPFRKTLEYFADTTQFYGVTFFEFIKIILKTKGYRTNTITTRVHWLLRRFYDIK